MKNRAFMLIEISECSAMKNIFNFETKMFPEIKDYLQSILRTYTERQNIYQTTFQFNKHTLKFWFGKKVKVLGCLVSQPVMKIFCSFHITHNIQKPISFLYKRGRQEYTFVPMSPFLCRSVLGPSSWGCKQKYDGSISTPG